MANDEKFQEEKAKATAMLAESESFILMHFTKEGVHTVMAIDRDDQRIAVEAADKLFEQLARGVIIDTLVDGIVSRMRKNGGE